MKIKIISDLHADINKGIVWNFDPDTFYVICGDISGDAEYTRDFVKKYIKQGVFVAGNHLGYSGHLTLDESLDLLRSNFNKGKVRFLNNNVYTVGKVVFIGTTLWTDFNLYGCVTECMEIAWNCLNDYRYVRTFNPKFGGMITRIGPLTTLGYFKKNVEYIEKQIQKHKDKKVVIVTHHAPSLKSIDDKYVYDKTSAAYASNLEWLIEKYSNIVLWCHGHVHSKARYRINHTRIVCEPYGYYNENLMDLSDLGYEINV